jgi:hypothetical protein
MLVRYLDLQVYGVLKKFFNCHYHFELSLVVLIVNCLLFFIFIFVQKSNVHELFGNGNSAILSPMQMSIPALIGKG